MSTELVVIFRTQSEVEASIVRGLLETHGVPSILSSSARASRFPVSVNELGEVAISVRSPDADEARRITAAIDDLEDVVTNVIADTRGTRRASEARGVDLGDVVRERMAFWSVLARGQHRTVELRLHDGGLAVDAPRRDVQELVDVLVGNVLRHTPSGRAARVSTRPRPQGGGCLVIEDAGPGFATDRGPNGSTAGTGLGLDIARRLAREAGGALTLGHSELGGARVDVELGPARPATA
jgi:signal transduction histidine kinase